MIIVCTGGRNYADFNMVQDVLDRFKITKIHVGDAAGADQLVREYAEYHNIPLQVWQADWDEYGKAAGPIRNRQMVEAAHQDGIVIAFPGGRGTEDCIQTAVRYNMVVLRVEQ